MNNYILYYIFLILYLFIYELSQTTKNVSGLVSPGLDQVSSR